VPAQADLVLRVLDRAIAIRCDDPAVRDLLHANFAAMVVPRARPEVRYRIAGDGDVYRVWRGTEIVGSAADLGSLTYLLDSDLVIRLQLMRRDLLFVHGAVVTDAAGAHVLTGRSGAGKSTTCWGLLHRGFGYLSDELAPVRLSDLTVHPFPRALCTKAAPPPGFELPRETAVTPRGFHVPVSRLPSWAPAVALPVRTLLFVEYAPGRLAPSLRAVSSAEAAARLYPNVLNALAHEDDGLRGIAAVASAARAFVVEAADLAATCDAIVAALRVPDHGSESREADTAQAVR
jgi:hypothetical protein